jgi:hypothetical protein
VVPWRRIALELTRTTSDRPQELRLTGFRAATVFHFGTHPKIGAHRFVGNGADTFVVAALEWDNPHAFPTGEVDDFDVGDTVVNDFVVAVERSLG